MYVDGKVVRFRKVTTKTKIKVIKKFKESFSINLLCEVLQISRSTWLKYKNFNFAEAKQFVKDINFVEYIQQIFLWSRKQFGYRRITKYLYLLLGIKTSETRVKRLMKIWKIKPVYVIRMQRRQKRRQKQRENERFKTIDHVNREFSKFTAPNQCWYTDVSVHVWKGQHFYQSTIIDAYTLNIVDFKLSDKNDTDLVLVNLKDALKQQKNPSEVIIHSDHGIQYFSDKFLEECRNSNIIISKGSAYTCADNVIIEIFHSHLKKGTIHNNSYKSMEEYWLDVEEWNDWYYKYKLIENMNYTFKNS